METQIPERRLEKLGDFNLIYLVNFEKLRLDEMVLGSFQKKFDSKVVVKVLFSKKIIDNPELPENVVESFKLGEEKVLHEGVIYKKSTDSDGNVYYDAYTDATHLVNEVLDLPVLKYTLKTISDLIGKSVMTKDLLSLPGFRTIDNEKYGNITLKLTELSEKGNKIRTSKISLEIEKEGLQTSADLGILNYSIYGRRL